MADTGRTPDTTWRDDDIERLGTRVRLIGVVNYELENLHEMFQADGDEQTCQEIRNLEARFRLIAADLVTRQRDLRAAQNPQPQLPMSVTVRRLRPLEEHAE